MDNKFVDNLLADLNRRLPFTKGLTGEALADAIAKNWFNIDPFDKQHLFKRFAMDVAQREAAA
jgi:hypothetical protein